MIFSSGDARTRRYGAQIVVVAHREMMEHLQKVGLAQHLRVADVPAKGNRHIEDKVALVESLERALAGDPNVSDGIFDDLGLPTEDDDGDDPPAK